MVRALLLLATLGSVACDEPECDDMLASPAGLVVTAAEHPSAWGERECDACHLRPALHRRACTPGVDLAAVRSQADADASVESCMDCHGDNGSLP